VLSELAQKFVGTTRVRLKLRPQARPSNDMAPVGQRMLRRREVSVRALAACSSLAARAAGRFARSMPFQSALYATVPLAVTIIRAAASSASESEPESASAGHHFSLSNADGTPLRSNAHVPSSPKHFSVGGRQEVAASLLAV